MQPEVFSTMVISSEESAVRLPREGETCVDRFSGNAESRFSSTEKLCNVVSRLTRNRLTIVDLGLVPERASCCGTIMMDGYGVGCSVGIADGPGEGTWLGTGDGATVGVSVGSAVGVSLGAADGPVLGSDVGRTVGVDDGDAVGSGLGSDVGRVVGISVIEIPKLPETPSNSNKASTHATLT